MKAANASNKSQTKSAADDGIAKTYLSAMLEQGIIAAELLADTLAREHQALRQHDIRSLSEVAQEKLRYTEELSAVTDSLQKTIRSLHAHGRTRVPHRRHFAALLDRCQKQHAQNNALARTLVRR